MADQSSVSSMSVSDSELNNVPVGTLLKTLCARFFNKLVWPFRVIGRFFYGCIVKTHSDSEHVPTTEPTEPTEPNTAETNLNMPPKNPLCLKLESLSDRIRDLHELGTYSVLIVHDGELQEKFTRKLGVFGTYKDLISWLFGPQGPTEYELYVLVYPHWIKVAKTGEFLPSKIFHVKNKAGEIQYIVSAHPYGKSKFPTDKEEAKELSRRVKERDNVEGAHTDGPVALAG